MSTISAATRAGSAWSDLSSSRATAMKDKLFAKVDSDGSGTVDKSELQGMLDQIAEKSGSSIGSADDLFSTMDSDSDGSLSADELDSGMKSLMPEPSSTMDFAQQRTGAASGPPAGGPPPAGASSSSSSTDPLDTDGDGTVSSQERAVGELKEFLANITSGIDSDGDKTVSQTEADTFKSQLSSLVDMALKQYGQIVASSSTASSTAISVAA